MNNGGKDRRVAVVIPAKDEEETVAGTVRAARAIPHVDLVLVVDDGSSDRTQHAARAAGAVVVRHSVCRGKASAMETGGSVVAMRDAEGAPKRTLLFLDADLGESAVAASALVEPVLSGKVDCAIAVLPSQRGAGGFGMVKGLAKRAIAATTGWNVTAPLSGQRCISREAFDAAAPLAKGWGVEVGMTIDLLVAGYTLQEIPCDIHHRATGNNRAGMMHRLSQYKDVQMAVKARAMRGIRVPIRRRASAQSSQQLFAPYRAY